LRAKYKQGDNKKQSQKRAQYWFNIMRELQGFVLLYMLMEIPFADLELFFTAFILGQEFLPHQKATTTPIGTAIKGKLDNSPTMTVMPATVQTTSASIKKRRSLASRRTWRVIEVLFTLVPFQSLRPLFPQFGVRLGCFACGSQ